MFGQKFTPTRQPEPVLGARLLDLDLSDEFQLAERINAGLAPGVVASLAERLGVPVGALLDLAGIKDSTYYDRKRRHHPLSMDESSRLYRIARATEAAVAYFEGNEAAARRWLTHPKVALGGKTPLEFARSPEGSDYVVQLLDRLEHGVIS